MISPLIDGEGGLYRKGGGRHGEQTGSQRLSNLCRLLTPEGEREKKFGFAITRRSHELSRETRGQTKESFTPHKFFVTGLFLLGLPCSICRLSQGEERQKHLGGEGGGVGWQKKKGGGTKVTQGWVLRRYQRWHRKITALAWHRPDR